MAFNNYQIIFCEGNGIDIQNYLINKCGFSWYFSIDKHACGNPIHELAEVIIIDSDMTMERFKKHSHFQYRSDYLVYKDSVYQKCIYGSNENWKKEIDNFINTPRVTARNLKREISKNSEEAEVIIMIGDKECTIKDIEDMDNKVVLVCEEE